MPLDVVYGESRDRPFAQRLAEVLKSAVTEGTIYLAYPVLATADERIEVDGLLVSQAHGLVAFLLAKDVPTTGRDWSKYVEEQDRLYSVLEANLRRHEGLRRGRGLAVTPATATVFPDSVTPPDAAEGFYGEITEAPAWLETLDPIEEDVKRNLEAALQRVATIKPAKKRTSVETDTSRGAVLKRIEKEIANLDRWQKGAAIESPEGPQRIRGLAGSGKTVVLALKASYWHSQHPEWNIAVTFHTRALYQQIADLATRFTFEHSNDKPDPEHLRIIHSWGSRSRPGIYSMIAIALGQPPRDWSYALGKYGRDDAFRGVCQELLDLTLAQEFVTPIFDAVLIDEAQDLPPEFFQLVYMFTRDPKRIVWAYDELQRLSESTMPSTDELFGTDDENQSLVSLDNPPNGPRRDIVLPVCYRNTPWALATAHAFGIGAYRPEGPIQHPDDPRLWHDIGYDVLAGKLTLGSRVTLGRRRDSTPTYFENYLDPSDAVVIGTFADAKAQDEWVAQEIRRNLDADELEMDDILIVLPDTYRAKSRGPHLMATLRRYRIESHLVGVTTNVDSVFSPTSVAIAHIHRAKGNEAPMVYVLDAQYGASTFNAVTRRNTIFTAITRSRAWVRITGWGDNMATVLAETQEVAQNQYRLRFKIPTYGELQTLRHIHRERSVQDEESVRRATEGLSAFLEAIEQGELDFHDIPPELRTQLIRKLQEDSPGADE